jgi:hypothetical protein
MKQTGENFVSAINHNSCPKFGYELLFRKSGISTTIHSRLEENLMKKI